MKQTLEHLFAVQHVLPLPGLSVTQALYYQRLPAAFSKAQALRRGSRYLSRRTISRYLRAYRQQGYLRYDLQPDGAPRLGHYHKSQPSQTQQNTHNSTI